MSLDRLHQSLLGLGLVISAMLLIRFAFDFAEEMNWLLAAPFWVLVIIALGVTATGLFRGASYSTGNAHRRSYDFNRALLLVSIPLGFMASSLDCMGLNLQGCSPFCTLVKLVWIPLIGLFCAVYFFTNKRGWLVVITVASFVTLVPHCVCYNLGNAWWIDRIGTSPLCYGWGFAVSGIACGALRSGAHLRLSIVTCGLIIAGATGFFVAHHYFHFPW